MPQSWCRAVCVAGAIVFGSFVPTTVPATTVIQLGTHELLTTAEFVFEGEAIDIRTSRDPANGNINTVVTFSVADVIKGDYSGATIELSFMGGRYGNETVGIAGMIYPTLGERGVYFVENTSGLQVHPMYGWSQGHFIVDAPASGDNARVYTAGFDPVYDLSLQSVGFGTAYSNGRVSGLVTAAPFTDAQPLPLGEFKARLRGFMRQLSIPEPITRMEDPK